MGNRAGILSRVHLLKSPPSKCGPLSTFRPCKLNLPSDDWVAVSFCRRATSQSTHFIERVMTPNSYRYCRSLIGYFALAVVVSTAGIRALADEPQLPNTLSPDELKEG